MSSHDAPCDINTSQLSSLHISTALSSGSNWIHAVGFEFSKEEEENFHYKVLLPLREPQRSLFRALSGASSSAAASDVLCRNRTKKGLMRIFRTLSQQFSFPLLDSSLTSDEDCIFPFVIREACRYTNTLEDAFQFIGFQFESAYLPAALARKRPLQLTRMTEPVTPFRDSNAVDIANGLKKISAAEDKQEIKGGILKAEEKKLEQELVESAMSLEWTKRYLDQESGEDIDDSSVVQKDIVRLESIMNDLMREYQCLKANTSGVKMKKKKLNKLTQEIDAYKLELVRLGWEDKMLSKLEQSDRIETNEFERDVRDVKVTPVQEEEESFFGCMMDVEQMLEPQVKPKLPTNANDDLLERTYEENYNIPRTWTGKTPLELLHEHCRKLRYQVPRFDRVRRVQSNRFLFEIEILPQNKKGIRQIVFPLESVVDPDDSPKGRSKTRISLEYFAVNPEVQWLANNGFAVSNQAKQYIATCALYALASDSSMDRLLPAPFKDVWNQFALFKRNQSVDKKMEDKLTLDTWIEGILHDIPADLKTTYSCKPAKTNNTATDLGITNWNVNDWDADEGVSRMLETQDDACSKVSLKSPNVSLLDRRASESFERIKERAIGRMCGSKYAQYAKDRSELPIAGFRHEILQAISTHNVVLISGETGCGKSTQVPHILLESLLKSSKDSFHIVCTQPRRLAAISIAERVAKELGENHNTPIGSFHSICGYQTRLDTRMHDNTRLLFCTTGVLIRRLQNPSYHRQITHIIVDEVHERDVQTDILLTWLRQFVQEQSDTCMLKVIIMSATLQADVFQNYFGGAECCPMISVPGRMHEVTELYLEDVLEITQYIVEADDIDDIGLEDIDFTQKGKIDVQRLTKQLQKTDFHEPSQVSNPHAVEYAAKNSSYGLQTLDSMRRLEPYSDVSYPLVVHLLEYLIRTAHPALHIPIFAKYSSVSILIFLPGMQEINLLMNLMHGSSVISGHDAAIPIDLIALHSSIEGSAQQRAFDYVLASNNSPVTKSTMPRRIRVIVATNIAETSLTIEDVKVVIDCGRVKQIRHDPDHRTNVLESVWASKANVKQRRGRAGRTSKGLCIRLYPRYVYDHVMSEQPIPEMKRTSLTSLCLQIAAVIENFSCQYFFSQCLDPPDQSMVASALQQLREIGAMQTLEHISHDKNTLTPLGEQLAKLPVDVNAGKLLILGAVFDILDPISSCAAILESKSPFSGPSHRQGELNEVRSRFATGASDILTDAAAYELWHLQFNKSDIGRKGKSASSWQDEMRFCQENCLDMSSLRVISKLKKQFMRILKATGIYEEVSKPAKIRDHIPLLCALLYAGFYPNVVAYSPKAHQTHIKQNQSRRRLAWLDCKRNVAYLHPSSVHQLRNAQNSSKQYMNSLERLLASGVPTLFMTYPSKLETSDIFLPSASLVTPVMIALFGDSLLLNIQVSNEKNTPFVFQLVANEWIALECSLRSAMLLLGTRCLLQDFLRRAFECKSYVSIRETDIKTLREQCIKAVTTLCESEYQHYFPTSSSYTTASSFPSSKEHEEN